MVEDRHLHMETYEQAIAFARQTVKVYRTCVLQNGRNGKKLHHASLPQYRRGFIESYLVLKRFYRFSRDGDLDGTGI
jgi:hypothetical protein